MNKNQVRGSVKEAAGRIQAGAGKALGSTQQRAKGLAKELEGKVQKGYGDAEQATADKDQKRRER
jgi:uncharacterized protein YjbJ (UPF0337 family)